jgi:hypothetical protein
VVAAADIQALTVTQDLFLRSRHPRMPVSFNVPEWPTAVMRNVQLSDVEDDDSDLEPPCPFFVRILHMRT